ncbi:keratin-associated protein 19-2-like [Penaeus japonicus]|uniref:keratin-associated protein 19-2-like n=1 Tax=Penaeus japonicus TaxID=27405 RepID=UPI001C7165D6|nr:keratin-associated protein 19-2-like [Penaeus japonicus]
MKALIAVLLVACVAAEQKREAEPSYRHGVGFPLPYGAVGGHHYGVGYGHAAIAHHPYGGHSYVQSYSHNLHKREADPGYTHPAYGYGYGRGIGYGIGHSYGYGPAVAHHPYGGHSYVQSYSHNLHKREADPGYTHPAYGYGYGRGIGYGISHTYGYGPAVAHHPYGGLSFSQSYNHILHKRDADPSYGFSHGHSGSACEYTNSVAPSRIQLFYQQNHGVVSPYNFDY